MRTLIPRAAAAVAVPAAAAAGSAVLGWGAGHRRRLQPTRRRATLAAGQP